VNFAPEADVRGFMDSWIHGLEFLDRGQVGMIVGDGVFRCLEAVVWGGGVG